MNHVAIVIGHLEPSVSIYTLPNGITVEGVDTYKPATQPSAGADEEGFFLSWGKPAPKAKTASPPPNPPHRHPLHALFPPFPPPLLHQPQFLLY